MKSKLVTLNNGIKMPIIGFGTYPLANDTCILLHCEAIKVGYRLIDTARMYKNEKAVGEGIKKCGIPREDLFITTKILVLILLMNELKQQLKIHFLI